jgi:glycosyltransferase involved in cell wall biosynthesis
MDQLKVCIVASTYPRTESDYAVPWLRESVARLSARGHLVTVLAPSYKGLKDHTIDGVPVRRFRYAPAAMETLTHEEGAPNKVGGFGRKLLGIPYIACGRRAAAQLCSDQKFDVVHVHWPFPHETIGSVIARRCGAPLILNCHGAEFAMARKKWWVKSWLRHSLQQGDLIIANSSDTANHVRELSGREAVVVPYGSSVPDLSFEPVVNSVPRVLFTGRLIERKGVEFLIKAIPHILAQRRVEVVITGNGDQRPRLEAMVQAMGLGDVVRFLGFVTTEQLAAEYASCDMWVNPAIIDSRGDTEGLGVGAIEAYSYGKPVIASAVGGIPDAVIHKETGLLVPEKDEFALADAILQCANNPEWAARLGRHGQNFARQQFSWDRITNVLENLYNGAIFQAEIGSTATGQPIGVAG